MCYYCWIQIVWPYGILDTVGGFDIKKGGKVKKYGWILNGFKAGLQWFKKGETYSAPPLENRVYLLKLQIMIYDLQ